MNRTAQESRRLAVLATAAVVAALGLAIVPAVAASAQTVPQGAHSAGIADLPVPPGAVRHVMVIELENESESATFGANSPATYLNHTLVPEGEFLQNYYAVGHVSRGQLHRPSIRAGAQPGYQQRLRYEHYVAVG